ncbi:MAG TPA: exonuclease SbcCD subunit D [Acidimicrobiales bacterium]
MKLLHTSDWHLGRTFHGAPLLEHQTAAVDALVEVVRSERVDVVVLAGDIYDRQLPSGDAVEALSYALCELRAAGARVVGIAGNHDSAVRLGFAEPVLAAGGVSIRGDLGTIGTPVLVEPDDGGPPVAVFPIPYLEPEVARHRLGLADARSHDQLLRAALDRARADLAGRGNVRSVAVVHAFVAGGQACDSERVLSVGGSAEVGIDAFAGFDYVALGHLHGRQVFGEGRVRYSGSPLAYSFSERSHTKSAWLVTMDATGAVEADAVDLPVPRPLAVVEGSLEELLTSALHATAEPAWVHAVLTDPVLPPESMARLRARFPHTLTLTHRPPASDVPAAGYAERVRGKADIDLTLDFVEHVTGSPADEAERTLLVDVLDRVDAEGGP